MTTPATTAPTPQDQPRARPSSRAIAWTVLRAAGSVVALIAIYYLLPLDHSTSNFGGHLSHTDGLYFAVTVFSTVGFGDITAKTETALLVVTGQMIADLIILGLAVKIILGAVKRSQRQSNPEVTADHHDEEQMKGKG
jgi:hypothetical protein